MSGKKQSARNKRRVFIVDDHPLVRHGITQLINQQCDLVVCGQAGDAGCSVKCIAECKPDLVIVDICLKGADGIQLIKQLRKQDPRLLLLVVSMHDESVYAERALRAGARGYVMKQEAAEEVIRAVRKIFNGEIAVSKRITTQMLSRFLSTGEELTRSGIDALTNRELQVFRLIGLGRRTREIASELNLSIKTIEAYRENIKKKLGLGNTTELTVRAAQWISGEQGV